MGLFNQLLYLVPELFSLSLPPVLLSQYWKFSTAHSRKAATEWTGQRRAVPSLPASNWINIDSLCWKTEILTVCADACGVSSYRLKPTRPPHTDRVKCNWLGFPGLDSIHLLPLAMSESAPFVNNFETQLFPPWVLGKIIVWCDKPKLLSVCCRLQSGNSSNSLFLFLLKRFALIATSAKEPTTRYANRNTSRAWWKNVSVIDLRHLMCTCARCKCVVV